MSNRTVKQHSNGTIVIHLGSGNGTLTAPRGVAYETCRKVVCEDYPHGTHSRRARIIAQLRKEGCEL